MPRPRFSTVSPSVDPPNPAESGRFEGTFLYLFTTFPVLTETFLQREVRALRALGVELELHSIWKGASSFEGHPVRRFHLIRLWRLAIELPYWILKRPRQLTSVLRALRTAAPPNFQNFEENALGLAYGILIARRVARHPPSWIHAAWATMPATAALTIESLTGQPFSTGAHAYDIFQGGGDWILDRKIRRAKFLHASTRAARDHLIRRGARVDQVLFLRRGLLPLPPLRPHRPMPPDRPLRLLTVGRLVPKKDFSLFLEIVLRLQSRGIACDPRIIGEGPEKARLSRQAAQLGLDPTTLLAGRREPAEVEDAMRRADFLLFTGKPAPDGDRDGLPNVIPEAMAIGLPVVASDQPGVREAIEGGRTGELVDSRNPLDWADRIASLRDDPEGCARRIQSAREWIEQHFDARIQAKALLDRITRARQDP